MFKPQVLGLLGKSFRSEASITALRMAVEVQVMGAALRTDLLQNLAQRVGLSRHDLKLLWMPLDAADANGHRTESMQP